MVLEMLRYKVKFCEYFETFQFLFVPLQSRQLSNKIVGCHQQVITSLSLAFPTPNCCLSCWYQVVVSLLFILGVVLASIHHAAGCLGVYIYLLILNFFSFRWSACSGVATGRWITGPVYSLSQCRNVQHWAQCRNANTLQHMGPGVR